MAALELASADHPRLARVPPDFIKPIFGTFTETNVSKPETINKDKAAGPKRIEKTLPQGVLNVLRVAVRFGSRVCWRLEHKGVENIPQNSGLIIAANHQSYADPFWLALPVRTPIRFLAWSEAFSGRS